MKRFKRILCVMEPDNPSKQMLERAVLLARNNQASLTVVAIMPTVMAYGLLPMGITMANLQAVKVSGYQKTLESLLAPYREDSKIKARVLVGTPFLQIIREVLRNDHDLVIKNPEREDFLDQLLGSDDMHLLRKCPCPVWLIKSGAAKKYRRILAAVDVDDSHPPEETEASRKMNHQILELASSLAMADFAELHLVHIWYPVGESTMRGPFLNASDEQVDVYVEQVRKTSAANLRSLLKEVSSGRAGEALTYLKPHTHLLKGWAREEIPKLARQIDADLIVMGTVARTGIPGFIMGNTAETILNQIDCSILAIKPEGFVTPVKLEE